jgi:hypothetical protein
MTAKKNEIFILQSEMKLFVLFCRFTRTSRLADEVEAAARQLRPTRKARLPQVDPASPTSLQQE